MVTINPLDVFLWTLRRNEKDVVNLYNTLSPVMQLATGGDMLNFGLWSSKHNVPLLAQNNLCDYFGELAELENAKNILDVGSGLSAPARFWAKKYPALKISCININFKQLAFDNAAQNIELLNCSSTELPIAGNSVDRVIALESAQHFKPLEQFFSESKRVLKNNGFFVLAMPITLKNSTLENLGILKFTWSSEHYRLDYVKNLIQSSGFTIMDEHLIGRDVYVPLANYYVSNRNHLQKYILKKYPKYVESILHKSILKMKIASEKQIIDYVLLKCKL
ncbi:class I SAM-dependent methyltransferase [Nitrosopumilus sp. K4]|uniref:class I SAM-dependent methyltransferase n=1 Tax=Nitrosopumilus sp. K4 TaxID=2795383 RepID=UPI001BA78492|nr:class I SAM-dependent methyltransferase [Nitrosopumilus sp. K4]QUC65196.1 class I SAM-dependent methyltransferase [Nitrosopumilus sp. K4]